MSDAMRFRVWDGREWVPFRLHDIERGLLYYGDGKIICVDCNEENDHRVMLDAWIPVTKRLPAVDARVLVVAESHGVVSKPFVATYQGGDAWEDDGGNYDFEPLCWAPLLEPPADPRAVL